MKDGGSVSLWDPPGIAIFKAVTVPHAAGLVCALLSIGLVSAALLGQDGVGRHDRLSAELERVRAINAELKAENRRLAVERRALRHDPGYIEAVIREDLGFVRPDEVVLELAEP